MTIVRLITKLYRSGNIILISAVGLLFFWLAVKIVDPVDYPNNDFFTFWLGGHLAAAGQNPYLAELWVGGHHQFGASWIPNNTFIYPLPLALLFIPLGLLPLYQAYVLWVFLSQVMIVLAIALLLSFYPGRLKKLLILPILAGVVLFRPTLLTLIDGQLSGFLLLVIVCIACLWERGKWWQGAVLLPVLALKPNLGGPIIVLLSIYLLLQRKITPLALGFVSGLLILATGFIQNVGWISEFWQAGNTKLSTTFGYSPTVWGMSSLACNYELGCSVWLGAVFGSIFLLGYWLLLTRAKLTPTQVVGLVMAVTLLITPYTWPYDQILLIIPLITVIMGLAQTGTRFALTAMIFLVFDFAAIVLLKISADVQKEIWNVFIPLAVFGLLAWHLGKGIRLAQGTVK